MEETKENYSEGLGKKLLTPKYILIYVILAIVVYGGIYFLFLRNNSSYSPSSTNYQNDYNSPAPTTNSNDTTQTQPTTATPWTVDLTAQNGSGETGTATLEDVDGKTKVTITLTGEAANASQPAHIHTGACPTPGAVKFPLKDVVGGTSQTIIDTTVAQIKTMMPLAINLHKSAKEIGTYVACGDVK